MSNYIIKMPDIGEGIAQVELVAWHVKPGDMVTEDQVLADVMTDKATVEIPSPVVGKIVSLGGEVGQQIAVGAELIRLEVEGAGNIKGDAPPAHPRPAQAAAPAAPVAAKFAVPAPAQQSSSPQPAVSQRNAPEREPAPMPPRSSPAPAPIGRRAAAAMPRRTRPSPPGWPRWSRRGRPAASASPR